MSILSFLFCLSLRLLTLTSVHHSEVYQSTLIQLALQDFKCFKFQEAKDSLQPQKIVGLVLDRFPQFNDPNNQGR